MIRELNARVMARQLEEDCLDSCIGKYVKGEGYVLHSDGGYRYVLFNDGVFHRTLLGAEFDEDAQREVEQRILVASMKWALGMECENVPVIASIDGTNALVFDFSAYYPNGHRHILSTHSGVFGGTVPGPGIGLTDHLLRGGMLRVPVDKVPDGGFSHIIHANGQKYVALPDPGTDLNRYSAFVELSCSG